MESRLAEVRRAIAALGKRGRTTPVPQAVREQVLQYAAAERARGKSWQVLAREIGLSASGLQRWMQGRTPPRLQRVRVVADRAPQEILVTLVSPAGYRLEGLELEQALAALRQLG
jgi:transcriptional regulator with XRE-family HTH domain